MRRILSTVLILALIACGALAEGDQQVAMRIVICEEQNFSTLCKPEYDYSYTPDGGLTLELGPDEDGPCVTIFKTDAPSDEFDAEYYFRNTYPESLRAAYGSGVINIGEYTVYTLGGREMPGCMSHYVANGQAMVSFCAMDLRGDCFVRYEATSPSVDTELKAALTALAVAVGNFQPNAYYYSAGKSEPEKTETPAPQDTQYAKPLEGSIFDWQGFSVKPLRYRLSKYEGSSATMTVYVQVRNDTDQSLLLMLEDVYMSGVEISAFGIYNIEPNSDTGTAEPENFYFYAPSDNRDAASDAIVDGHSVEATLVLKNSSLKDLYRQKVVIDLDALEAKRTVETPAPTPKSTPKPTATPKPAAPKESYRTLCRGDKGEDVRRLQQKLIDLGYLNHRAEGAFGAKTAAAVKMFNEANGLGSSNAATALTQDCLYSGLAKRYTEPWIPVDIPRVEWRKPTGDGGSYRVKITNTSKTRTIKGIELQYYPENVWGQKLWDYDYRKSTFTMTIKPGKSAYTTYFYMSPSFYTIDKIYLGISKVAFDDGTVHYNDDITYWTVTLH